MEGRAYKNSNIENLPTSVILELSTGLIRKEEIFCRFYQDNIRIDEENGTESISTDTLIISDSYVNKGG